MYALENSRCIAKLKLASRKQLKFELELITTNAISEYATSVHIPLSVVHQKHIPPSPLLSPSEATLSFQFPKIKFKR
jgi:hypothetical protein